MKIKLLAPQKSIVYLPNSEISRYKEVLILTTIQLLCYNKDLQYNCKALLSSSLYVISADIKFFFTSLSKLNFSSAIVITSDVTSFSNVTDVAIKGREINKGFLKKISNS